MEWSGQLFNFLRTPPLVGEPLSRYTSLGVGGPADYLVFPGNMDELRAVLLLAREHHVPLFVLGHGTNLLVRDEGFRGVVISLTSLCSCCEFFDGRVKAGAAVSLPWLAREIACRGLTGMEFAAGIPGTLGGALYMNAGAFGCRIGDLVEEVVSINRDGCCRTRSRTDLAFSYRWSIFQEDDDIILEAILALQPGNREEIEEIQGRMLHERTVRHPRQSSAGSVFRNPREKGAGYLIEQAGLKGMKVGGAQISPMHGNFIVNTGNAAAADILSLISVARERVKQIFGIDLELEIRVIGGNRENRGEDK